ncbi:cilia- and flagella-associated protein 161 [Poecilia reticulata]|uniref:Cilia and flagella associated protein 161 n=1 Tax=Poecilia reticulata TaxID=8081 RepID=A0A3P9NHF2_POERE|nr:PREDICTED: cilia- and flagella-associated protein 161 [Poecilia reticulata]
MTYQRQYQPKVKTGNWFEDLVLKEETITEFLNKRSRGELLSQRVDFLKQNILAHVNLSATFDGQLRFGDVVMLVSVGGQNREHSALSINANIDNLTKTPEPSIKMPCGVSGGKGIQSCVRTAFIITSVDGSPEGSTLHFDQSFALRTTGFAKGLYLTSDKPRFQKCAKKSGLQDVYLDDTLSVLSWWKISHFDPQERFESEGLPVPANEKVLVIHCMTNEGLAVLGEKLLWTAYGTEYEVVAHTFLDTHRAEQDVNFWILGTSDPAGDGLLFLRNLHVQQPT